MKNLSVLSSSIKFHGGIMKSKLGTVRKIQFLQSCKALTALGIIVRRKKGKECERGGNGSDNNKCSCGFKTKRWNGMGCFIGTIMAKFKPALKKLVETR